MSRDNKILAASAILQVIVAGAKAGVSSPDQILETIKGELFPLAINVGGLALMLKFIK